MIQTTSIKDIIDELLLGEIINWYDFQFKLNFNPIFRWEIAIGAEQNTPTLYIYSKNNDGQPVVVRTIPIHDGGSKESFVISEDNTTENEKEYNIIEFLKKELLFKLFHDPDSVEKLHIVDIHFQADNHNNTFILLKLSRPTVYIDNNMVYTYVRHRAYYLDEKLTYEDPQFRIDEFL